MIRRLSFFQSVRLSEWEIFFSFFFFDSFDTTHYKLLIFSPLVINVFSTGTYLSLSLCLSLSLFLYLYLSVTLSRSLHLSLTLFLYFFFSLSLSVLTVCWFFSYFRFNTIIVLKSAKERPVPFQICYLTSNSKAWLKNWYFFAIMKNILCNE